MNPTRRSVLRGLAATVAAALVAPKIPALGDHAWTLVRIVEPGERQDMKLWAYTQQYGASEWEVHNVVTGRIASIERDSRRRKLTTIKNKMSSFDYAALERRIAARWLPQALWRNEAGEYACTFVRGFPMFTATPVLDPDGTWDRPYKAAESRAMRYRPGDPPKPGTTTYSTEPEAILGRRLS